MKIRDVIIDLVDSFLGLLAIGLLVFVTYEEPGTANDSAVRFALITLISIAMTIRNRLPPPKDRKLP